MDLLRAALGAVREGCGRARPAQARLGRAGPCAWGDVWQALGRLQDETERFNLDKRQALVSGIALLNGTRLDVITGA